jgi:ABC-type multidrug transport system fused ATPase/permease subunit
MRWPLRTEFEIARQAVRILEHRERRILFLLIPPTLLVALLEVLGVASLAPFIALLSEPERFMKHRVLRWTWTTFGFTSLNDLFFCIGLGILVLLLVSNATAATTMWAMLRFAWMRNASLSTRLLRGYLYRPYAFFLERTVADLMKSVADVQFICLDVLWHMMALVARLFAIILISGTLFFIEPVLAGGAVAVFGGIYGGLFAVSRRRAARAGRTRLEADKRRHKLAMESLQGSREIKLYRLEDAVLHRYWRAAVEASRSASNHALLNLVPRYALETVAFGGVLVMMLYLLKTRHGLGGALPILGIYAFATMRLLPALQAVFVGFNSLRYNSTVVATVSKEFAAAPAAAQSGSEDPLTFEREVTLKDISFAYARAAKPALKDISVTLKRSDWVGFVGPTGSGKSTLVDVMLGLLEPTSGTLAVDGVPLTPSKHRAWQARTAYVPQQIFLVSDTVEANICFGIPPEQIDRQRLERAARIAQIYDFITRELPDGFKTWVGDRGIRLSGGQRQRIGIARALYREPRFLVLDEATSALDGATESAFFEALHAELKDVTVVSITHRLSTTRNFDRVYRLESGEIIDEVAPEALVEAAPAFTQ